MGSIMGSQNIMGSDYGSNISGTIEPSTAVSVSIGRFSIRRGDEGNVEFLNRKCL
jgi:hypothetical protein